MFGPAPADRVRARRPSAVAAAALALAVSAGVLATPPPAEAQTAAEYRVWSATLTVGVDAGYAGCDNEEAIPCVTGLSEDEFTYDGVTYQIFALYISPSGSSIPPGGSFLAELAHGDNWPAAIVASGRLRFDRTDVRFANSADDPHSQGLLWLQGNHSLSGWTNGQKVSVSLWAPVTDTLRGSYDWCYNRADEAACDGRIARWESAAPSVSLAAGRHCPDTHRIRTATASGVKCERTYSPVPAAGALAEAWGVTEIAPPSVLGDGWDGATRSCEPQSRGYVVLTTTRWHGLNQGCHSHSAIGGAHHEHSRQNH